MLDWTAIALIVVTVLITGIVTRRLPKALARRSVKLPGAPEVMASEPPTPPVAGYPDWRTPDNPPLEAWQLSARMLEMSALAGVDPTKLPRVVFPEKEDGEYLFREKFEYVYVSMLSGRPDFEYASVVADQILYRVFVEHSASVAAADMDARDYRDGNGSEVFDRRRAAVLARIDPRWAQCFDHERRRPASRWPLPASDVSGDCG